MAAPDARGSSTIPNEPSLAVGGPGKWMALAAALLGWMFDGLEMGLFPLVARPALQDLLGSSDSKDIEQWIGVITAGFLVGAATGGVLFGWLGDRVGRVRAMMLSVFTYAVFAGLCGIATTATQVAVFRFISALGMGGEWSLGVALVMEIWPNRSRGFLAGLIGAAANCGFLLIALVGLGLSTFMESLKEFAFDTGLKASWVEALFAHSGWRLLMLLGAAPALLTLLIRLFVPESERWRQHHALGGTSYWRARDLSAVVLGTVAACAIIYVWSGESWTQSSSVLAENILAIRVAVTLAGLAIAVVGYTYPVSRYIQRSTASQTQPTQQQTDEWRTTLGRMLLGAGLGGVALLGTWGSLQWATPWADKLTGGEMPEAKAYTQIWASIGAIIGTIAAAMIGTWYGRRITYFCLCVAALASAIVLFQLNDSYGPMFLASVFLAGMCTASFYGWLPLYLPELFTTRVRATGQGFSYNFGRVLAAVGVLQTGHLASNVFDNDYPQACLVTSLIYVVGMVLIWFAPETHGKPMPE